MLAIIKSSIIICCYNSAARIKATLKHLLLQKFVQLEQCEIIIVDNNSTDATSLIASEILKNSKFNWRIVIENQPGLLAARIAGFKNSNGELILYCDDDNWLDECYISEAVAFMDEHPEFGAITGFGQAVADKELPDWFESVEGMYACENKPFTELNAKSLTGAGIVIRRSILAKIFSPGIDLLLSGRRGAVLTSGDDTEISILISTMGWKLAKLESLRFKHYMPANRLTEAYRDKLSFGIGLSIPVICAYKFHTNCRAIWMIPANFRAILLKMYIFLILLNIKIWAWKNNSSQSSIKHRVDGIVQANNLSNLLKSVKTVVKNLRAIEGK